MAAFNINIDGGFFVTTDALPVTVELIRNARAETTFEFDPTTGTFQFFWKIVNANGTINSSILGNAVNTYVYPDLQTVTEIEMVAGVRTLTVIPIADAATLATYLSTKISVAQGNQTVNLGNQIIPKENTSTYKMLAQLQPSAPNTPESLYTPNANEEVHIKTITAVNENNQDIDMKFYLDDVGTTWDNTTLIANASIPKDKFDPSIMNGETIYMNNENGSLAFESSNVNANVTVWGVIYDLS